MAVLTPSASTDVSVSPWFTFLSGHSAVKLHTQKKSLATGPVGEGGWPRASRTPAEGCGLPLAAQACCTLVSPRMTGASDVIMQLTALNSDRGGGSYPSTRKRCGLDKAPVRHSRWNLKPGSPGRRGLTGIPEGVCMALPTTRSGVREERKAWFEPRGTQMTVLTLARHLSKHITDGWCPVQNTGALPGLVSQIKKLKQRQRSCLVPRGWAGGRQDLFWAGGVLCTPWLLKFLTPTQPNRATQKPAKKTRSVPMTPQRQAVRRPGGAEACRRAQRAQASMA